MQRSTGGTVDFKFKNNTDYPVRIEAYMTAATCRCACMARNSIRITLKFSTPPISTTEAGLVEKEDESVEPGTTVVKTSGHSGIVVDTYRYFIRRRRQPYRADLYHTQLLSRARPCDPLCCPANCLQTIRAHRRPALSRHLRYAVSVTVDFTV